MYNLTDKRNAIRELQRYLLEISYATSGIPHLAVDGIYGEETRATVAAFQLRNGLPVTGEADPSTWSEIYRQFDQAREARLAKPILISAAILPLALHARGSEVFLLQTLLDEVRLFLPELLPVAQNGNFDGETQRALRAYQTIRHLPPSGILDKETWNNLATDYQNRAKPPRYAG